METPEVPLEEVQERIHHTAHPQHSQHETPQRWSMGVALSTALFAALAAVASLIAGQKSNEAMSAQIESANFWGYYQAKSIKANLLQSKDELLNALGHDVVAKDIAKRNEYEVDKETAKLKAEAKEAESRLSLARHEWLAASVTLFQVAIALSAIALLTKRRIFWVFGLALGLVGVFFFAYGNFASLPENEISPALGKARKI